MANKPATAQQRLAAHSLAGTKQPNKRLSREQWLEVFEQARELTRAAAIGNVQQACAMAPEMLGLLADCARGVGTFEGASHAVRRMAALDVLQIATGSPDQYEFRNQPEKGKAINDLPLAEVIAFIDAGKQRLAQMKARASAVDAEVLPAASATDTTDRQQTGGSVRQQAGKP